MPVDIEQWRAGIGSFIGCCQYPVARIELRVYNIFSAIVMSACVFLLILLCISNLNTILHFLLVSSVFTFSPSVLELLIHKISCLKINILLYCIGSVSYIYQQISYTCIYVKYYQFFQCFALYVLFACPFSSACRYRAKSWSKITQLEAYNSLYKHDFVCISEMYFDSSILEGDSSFQLDG